MLNYNLIIALLLLFPLFKIKLRKIESRRREE